MHLYKYECFPPFILSYIFISWKGIRDDIGLLLDEDITSVNLCALHCEIRNTEQFLGSLGLFAFKIGSLDELNAHLSELGPNAMKKAFIRLKEGEIPTWLLLRHILKWHRFQVVYERVFMIVPYGIKKIPNGFP